MEYPEEIYVTRDGGLLTSNAGARWGNRNAYNIGCARGYQSGYEAGKADQPDPLAGYSNLTAAISAGEPIDYEKLDGKRVKCVKPEVGTLKGKLERNESGHADNHAGWWHKGADSLYRSAFIYGWTEHYGWTLWVEGEIPLLRKTADQLEVGTYFQGELGGRSIDLVYLGCPFDYEDKTVHYTPGMDESTATASEWVVLEEYGPFQKPEGK